MIILKITSLLLALSLLTGCNATPNTQSSSLGSSSNSAATAAHVENGQLTLAFFQKLSQAMSQHDSEFINQRINKAAIKKYALSIVNEQSLKRMYGNNWDQTIATAILKSVTSNKNTWQYLYSERDQSQSYSTAFFSIDQDDIQHYLSLIISSDGGYILDLKNATLQYSTIKFLSEYAQYIFKTKEEQGVNAQKNLITFFTEARTSDTKQILAAYSSLPKNTQTDTLVIEYFERVMVSYSLESQEKVLQALTTILRNSDINRPSMENIHVDNKHYDLAIESVNLLPQYALNHWYYQAELGALYAMKKQYQQAIYHGHRAIMSAPDKLMSYWMLMYLSILSNEYELAIQSLIVLQTKFQADISEEMLNELDEDGKFLASNAYSQWKKNQT